MEKPTPTNNWLAVVHLFILIIKQILRSVTAVVNTKSRFQVMTSLNSLF